MMTEDTTLSKILKDVAKRNKKALSQMDYEVLMFAARTVKKIEEKQHEDRSGNDGPAAA